MGKKLKTSFQRNRTVFGFRTKNRISGFQLTSLTITTQMFCKIAETKEKGAVCDLKSPTVMWKNCLR